MLLAINLCLLGLAASFKLYDDQNVDVFVQSGAKVELKAVADYWFKSCTLKNNFQQTICTITLSRLIPYLPVSDCNGDFRYIGDGKQHICQIEIQNVQKKGKQCIRLLIPISPF